MSNKLPHFTPKKPHLTKKTIPTNINGMFGENLRFDKNYNLGWGGGSLLLNHLH
jgi:hypothetical protein